MLEEKLLHAKTSKQWQKVGVKHHHGLCIPLFSIQTENSLGIGEYLDLKLLIDFCKEIGFDVIQLLPLYDTGLDTSPYNALSACALNPIHLSIHKLPFIEKMPNFEEKIGILRKYNSTPRVKYTIVRELKNEFLKEYFQLFYSEISKTSEYQDFIHNNSWLNVYGLFKVFKEMHQYNSWEEWPESYKNPTDHDYENYLKENKDEIAFHSFLQFFAFQQLREVKKYASEKGVFIKGDIPILISRDSCDVWAHREYFHLDLMAGAPPDMYAKEGQSWGFPVYDWEEIEKDNFSFWKERLALASSLFHLYRIDHVVGFFRIWAIPFGKKGNEGAFLPSDELSWLNQGKKIMEMMIESAPELLPIAEDLGTVPPLVRNCLRDLGICGTKVMRWERRWNEDGNFIPPSEYIPESMTTVSTHDSDTLQLWWRHAPKEALLYCKFMHWDFKPFLSLDRHYEILKESHHSASLFHINLLPEYLALFPELISANLYDERINIPGKTLSTNWTYRLKMPLEKLFSHPLLMRTLKEMLT